jgi:hypothetical protein
MKPIHIAVAAALAVAMSGPAMAEDTPNDIAAKEALGIDPTTTGATDEGRMAFFTAMSAEDQAAMKEKCTIYLGSEASVTENDVAATAAMSFCTVVTR